MSHALPLLPRAGRTLYESWRRPDIALHLVVLGGSLLLVVLQDGRVQRPLSRPHSLPGSCRSRSRAIVMIPAQLLAGIRVESSRGKRPSCSSSVKGLVGLPFGADTRIESVRPSLRVTPTRAAVERSLLAASTSGSSAMVVRSSSACNAGSDSPASKFVTV